MRVLDVDSESFGKIVSQVASNDGTLPTPLRHSQGDARNPVNILVTGLNIVPEICGSSSLPLASAAFAMHSKAALLQVMLGALLRAAPIPA